MTTATRDPKESKRTIQPEWPLRAARIRIRRTGTLLLAVLLLAGVGGRADEPVAVRVLTLRGEIVSEVVRLPAELKPRRRATLASELPGRVETVRSDLGSPVKKGAVLVSLDAGSTRQAVLEAKAVLSQMGLRFDRAKALFEERSITEGQLLDARTNNDVAKARLRTAELLLGKTEVRAPWAGFVNRRLVEIGDYLAPGTPVVELVDTRVIKAVAAVPAADAALIRTGASVRLLLEGDSPRTGSLRRVAPAIDPSTRTLVVEAEFPNREGRLRAGMPATIEIEERKLLDAIVVPLAATIDDEKGKIVYVVEDGAARRRRIEVGFRQEERVVVTSGLSLGEKLIVEGADRVADGAPVAALETDRP